MTWLVFPSLMSLCLRPLWARIFFRRSRSSRSLLSNTLAMTWLVFPSLMSLCLLRNQSGELTEEDTEKLITIMQNPRQYKIPDWFLNRQRDIKDGKTNQVMANVL